MLKKYVYLTLWFYRCENTMEKRKCYEQAYLHDWKMDQLWGLKSDCNKSKCL